MKWHNFNLAIRVKISTGTALILAVTSFFVYTILSKWIPAIGENYLSGAGALVGIFGIYLKQQDSSNKLDVQAARDDLGDKISRIKLAAMGQANGDAAAGTPPRPRARSSR